MHFTYVNSNLLADFPARSINDSSGRTWREIILEYELEEVISDAQIEIRMISIRQLNSILVVIQVVINQTFTAN